MGVAALGIGCRSWDLIDLIGASLGGIGAFAVSYDEATSSVGDQLDQGGVLSMQRIVYAHNKVVVCKVYLLTQDWWDFPFKVK